MAAFRAFIIASFLHDTLTGAQQTEVKGPIIERSPIVGDMVVLPCTVDEPGAGNVRWLSPKEQIVEYKGRFSLYKPYKKDWNLQISNVNSGDSGMYQCLITTINTIKYVELTVRTPPEILPVNNVTVLEHSKARLICNATGIPPPQIEWYRVTAADSTIQIGVNGSVLKIHNTSRFCGGVYMCIASNTITPDAKKTITVSLLYAPEIDVPTSDVFGQRGGEVTLTCDVMANPYNSTVWKREGTEIDKSLTYKYIRKDHKHEADDIQATLTIRELEVADYGRYTCSVSNEYGNDERQVHLRESTTGT